MIVKMKKIKESAILPTKGSVESAGFDLYVDTDKEETIPAHETVVFQTNIAMEIPKGYVGLIYARSGLSTKLGLRPSTCVSVIDSDYRGSVGVPIHNDTNEDKSIKAHERVAQLIIMKCPEVELVLVDNLDKTERGDNGFGSSGRF